MTTPPLQQSGPSGEPAPGAVRPARVRAVRRPCAGPVRRVCVAPSPARSPRRHARAGAGVAPAAARRPAPSPPRSPHRAPRRPLHAAAGRRHLRRDVPQRRPRAVAGAQRLGGDPAARSWLALAGLLAGAGLLWQALRAVGPLLAGPAALSWVLSAPVDRRAWLRPRFAGLLGAAAASAAVFAVFAAVAGGRTDGTALAVTGLTGAVCGVADRRSGGGRPDPAAPSLAPAGRAGPARRRRGRRTAGWSSPTWPGYGSPRPPCR